MFSPTGPILKLAKTIATDLQRCFLVVGSLKIGAIKKLKPRTQFLLKKICKPFTQRDTRLRNGGVKPMF